MPPPASRLAGLWDRFNGVLRLCSGRLIGLFLLTVSLPEIVVGLVVNGMFGGVIASGGLVIPGDAALGDEVPSGGLLIVALALALAALLLGALGWGAGIWTVTQVASGRQWSLGAALGAGARRLGPMFGWYLLYWLLVGIGLALCVLPGLYLAAAASLFSFVVMYQRGRSALAESFRLVHQALLPVVGRFLLVAGFMVTANVLVSCCFGRLSGDPEGTGPVVLVFGALADPLIYVVALVGLLLTYTQTRARTEPLTTQQLWRELNQAGEAPPGFPAAAHPGR